MQKADPEAAKELQIFNWANSPGKRIYYKELQRIECEKDIKGMIDSIRKNMKNLVG
ncbi:hypothetical protein HZA39_00775 [Candidatus Peregrinibacteria bacterium]|nr:hypothetical protein [Candidatus Peregrinibacteria bacterium]